MPSGPEHYEAAQNCLGLAQSADMGSDGERYYLGTAQVHATLALAAATALSKPHPEGGLDVDDLDAWRRVAATTAGEGNGK